MQYQRYYLGGSYAIAQESSEPQSQFVKASTIHESYATKDVRA